MLTPARNNLLMRFSTALGPFHGSTLPAALLRN
jgi:hypothetical protein